jgi:hypothetical protein
MRHADDAGDMGRQPILRLSSKADNRPKEKE